MNDASAVVRHLVATLAYRAAKAVREAPPMFGEFHTGAATRRPVQILAHMGDLMDWAIELARGNYIWKAGGSNDWDAEVERFFARLEMLDRVLGAGGIEARSIELLIQGPFADALTHVGQLTMLRGMAGMPVRPESYARAPIAAGRVGIDQRPPGREFDGDASAH